MNNTQSQNTSLPDEEGINLADALQFIIQNWKRAVVCAFLGAAVGLCGWVWLGTYKAEAVLINNGAINFLSWRSLQKNLPLLASQLLADHQVDKSEESMYKTMSDAKWWIKNVQPTYSLTKADTKDLATIGKDLQESGSTTILNLVVTASAPSKDTAEKNIHSATLFIKQGSAYLSIKNLIKGYESQILNSDANLKKQIADAERDLKYMRERAKNLEILRQRFPQNSASTNQQVVDAKDSNAKYMPISTQLVAINSDINNTVESLQKMRDQQAKEITLKTFVEQALPMMDKETNGLNLADALLAIVANLRMGTPADDINAQLSLNDIESTLVGIRTFFTKNLDTDLTPQITRSSPLLPTAAGFFAGAIALLGFALAKRLLPSLVTRKSY